MKRLSLFVIGTMLLITGILYAGRVQPRFSAHVDISSSGVLLAGERRRVEFTAVNYGTVNAVWISSMPINGSNYRQLGSIPIAPNYGSYTDNYYVARTSWYATTAGIVLSTSAVAIMEKE